METRELQERLETYAVRARAIAEMCNNEEQTKVSLVNPFIDLLGWDVRDPRQVQFEVRADLQSGTEKVDYALLRDGEPWIAVEAKAASTSLAEGSPSRQIERYAMALPLVEYCALTNGRRWVWYRKAGVRLEEQPFLAHDTTEPGPREVRWLAQISGGGASAEEAARVAEEEGLQSAFARWFEAARSDPPDSLLRLLLNETGRRATSQMVDRARNAWRGTIRNADARILARASRRFQSDETAAAEGPGEDTAPAEGNGRGKEADSVKRRWKYRWRLGGGGWRKAWNTKAAYVETATALFDAGCTVEKIEDALGTKMARLDEADAAPPRYKVLGKHRIAIWADIDRAEAERRMVAMQRIRPDLEIETEGGESASATPWDEWPWRPVRDAEGAAGRS